MGSDGKYSSLLPWKLKFHHTRHTGEKLIFSKANVLKIVYCSQQVINLYYETVNSQDTKLKYMNSFPLCFTFLL